MQPKPLDNEGPRHMTTASDEQDIELHDLTQRIDDTIRRLDTDHDHYFDPHSRAQFASHIARAIRPRIDHTEQLTALPIDTVVRDNDEVVCQLQPTYADDDQPQSAWYAIGDGHPATVALPAWVLDIPESQQ